MLKLLAERIVASIADYAVTYSYDGRAIRRLGLAHRLKDRQKLVDDLDRASPPTIEDSMGVGRVVRTGQPILIEELTPETLRQSATSAGHLETLFALSPRSAMIVPMNARGRTLGAIAFCATADSSRRYGAEDLQLGMELASRAALLVDNARLYAEAKAAIKAREEVLAIVSHDLRNPLQSMSSAAALLELSPSPERTARTLATISLAAKQMERLLNDLLDLSRMDSGELGVRLERIALGPLIEETATLFLPLVERKSVRLEVSIPLDLPDVHADGARIRQVLSNLLGNALKFVGAGGCIEVRADASKDHVRVTVVDDGQGIAEEHLGKVFDRFWRADRSDEAGSGLGLALSKGIIEAHRGTIGVESCEGEGSRFHFELPLARPREDLRPTRRAHRMTAPAN